MGKTRKKCHKKYHCKICLQDCKTDSVLCNSCNKWTHAVCVPMSTSLLSKWSSEKRTFLCYKCCHDSNDLFNARDALLRLSADQTVETAQDIQLLLQTYNVAVRPEPIFLDFDHLLDSVAKNIINRYQPIILEDYIPIKTGADGNCLYRALSTGLTGSEYHHLTIRLLTAIEMIVNKHHYNTATRHYKDLIDDVRVVTSCHKDLVNAACTIGAYSELIHMYAASAALKVVIHSYYPSSIKTDFYAAPFNRKIIGWNVKSKQTEITIMWSQTLPITSAFHPNHFVSLLPNKLCIASEIDIDAHVTINDDTTNDNIGDDTSNMTTNDNIGDDTSNMTTNDNIGDDTSNMTTNDNIGDDTSNMTTNDNIGDDTSNMTTNDNIGDDTTSMTIKDDIGDDTYVNDDIGDTTNITDDDDFGDETAVNDDIGDTTSITDDIDSMHANPVDDPCSGLLENGQFLETRRMIDILLNSVDKKDSIPHGPKNNVFFIINNKTNNDRRHDNRKSTFPDDCGVWDSKSGASPKTTYMTENNGQDYKKITPKTIDGHLMYCTEKSHKGRKQYIPLSPQPTADRLFTLQRHYTTLKADKTYKKRVTWILDLDKETAVVEYVGTHPGLRPHGNNKTDKNHYVRTPTDVMDDIKQLANNDMKPTQIYQKLMTKYDEMDAPSSIKQIKDAKRREKTKERLKNGQTHVGNIADHFGHIQTLVKDAHPFVRSVIHTSGKTPCIILYTDEQLKDLMTLCCSGHTILGFDKTFNLCDMHVTASCYKQLSVVRTDTKHPPLFLGPIFIHDNSDYETYCTFFSHLKTKLSGIDKTKLVIGTDDERAMVNAITDNFHDARHVLCTRHLKQNAIDKLENDKIDKNEKKNIIGKIFGDNGLVDSDDSFCFDDKCDEIQTLCQTAAPKFLTYFDKRLKDILKHKVTEPQRLGLIEKNWTNNNCESINHVLKHLCDWKNQTLTDLVQKIFDLVTVQYKDIRRAIIGTGQFKLADSHQKFGLTRDVWTSKTTDERNRHLCRLRNYIPPDAKTVTSSDGRTIIKGPRSLGKKPGQRKRKVADRTTTTTKKPRTENKTD